MSSAGRLEIAGRLAATNVGADEVPRLIDELPLVALAGAIARGDTVVRGAAELRVKETDRIETVTTSLKALACASRRAKMASG